VHGASVKRGERFSWDIAYNRLSDDVAPKVEPNRSPPADEIPPMNDLLFDTPLWLLGFLVIVGAALFWSGNNRQDKTLKRLGLAVLLAGLVLGVLSYFIDTDKERAVRQTRQIVAAIERKDWDGFSKLLDARTHVLIYNNRDDIVQGAKVTADAIGLKALHVTGMEVEQKDTVINVDFNVLSEQERSMGRPVVTSWRFVYQNFGAGWKLDTIEPLKSNEVNPDQIRANLQRLR
jgi:hypothetical protein